MTINRQNIPNSLGIPYEIIKRNSEKESEKTFTKVNMMGVLHDYINVMPYDRTTFVDRVGYQLENLGYIDIVDNQYKGYVVVLETETIIGINVHILIDNRFNA